MNRLAIARNYLQISVISVGDDSNLIFFLLLGSYRWLTLRRIVLEEPWYGLQTWMILKACMEKNGHYYPL
jgi:hypothetical protein